MLHVLEQVAVAAAWLTALVTLAVALYAAGIVIYDWLKGL